MKIFIKTLKGEQFPLDVEPDLKIADLRTKIAENFNIPVETQKLIAYGKMVDDEAKTLTDYKIAENGFIVVMQQKPRPQKKPEEAKQEETAPKPNVTLPAQAQAAQQPAAATQPPAATSTATQPQPQAPSQPSAPSQPPAANVDQETLDTLVAISGKPREMCSQALQMAQGNADLAFTILTEGIPAAGGNGDMPDYGDEYGQEAPGDNGGAGMPGGASPFAALTQHPDFDAIAQRIRENPTFYQEFMNNLQRQNPQLYGLIQQNPFEFMNLIMSYQPGMGGMPAGGNPAGGQGGMPPGMGAGAPRQRPPGTIQVTSQEMEAIQRLMSLGFSQHRALEAYLSCDKNEELAANLLFDSVVDDEQAMLAAALAQDQASAGVQQPAAQEQPQPQPAADAQQQPAAEGQQQPAAEQQQEQPPVDQQPGPDGGNNGNGDNNNGGAGGDGDAGAGDGGERSAFE